LDYGEVRRIHRLEKNSSQLSELKPDFFTELGAFLSKERDAYLSNLKNGSASKARDYSNLEEMSKELIAIRERKILNKALIASRTNEYSLAGLTKKEEALFKSVHSVLNDFKKDASLLFNSAKKPSREKGLKKLPLRILSDIPGFIGADMKEYGPFSKGQSVELPRKTAELLVQKKLAAGK